MYNKTFVEERVVNKFQNQMFDAIVAESFISALPLNQDEISPEEKRSLYHYCSKVLDTVGGFSVLESAVDPTKKHFSQNLYLGDIYRVCTEAATEAKNASMKKREKETDGAEIINKAALSDSDLRAFTKKADSLNLDSVSSLIKDKTIAVIKDEQEQYEKETELTQELKDVLMNSDNVGGDTNEEKEGIVESYIDIFLGRTAPRNHISLFSRLQESAMEMMNVMKVDHDQNIVPIVERVTLEAFFPDYKQESPLWTAMEAISNEEMTEIPQNGRVKYATLISIIVYTMMETLKTMNIFCPSPTSIRNFVDRPVNGHVIANEDGKLSYDKAERSVKEANLKDFSKMNTSELTSKLVEMKQVSSAAENYLRSNPTSERAIRLLSNVTRLTQSMESSLAKRAEQLKKKPATEGYYASLERDNDIAQFDKIHRIFKAKPNVDEIRFLLDMDGMSSIIAVEAYNKAGQKTGQSFVKISQACEQSELIDKLRNAYQDSKLSSGTKTCTMVLNDGRSTKMMF